MASRWSASSSSRGILCIFVIEPSKYAIGSFRNRSTDFALTGPSCTEIVKGVEQFVKRLFRRPVSCAAMMRAIGLGFLAFVLGAAGGGNLAAVTALRDGGAASEALAAAKLREAFAAR
jgi:hypothetical protein